MVVNEKGMLGGKGHEGIFKDDVGGEHVGVYLLKIHQVVHLVFVQIAWGKLYFYMKKKNNEISVDLPKQLKLKRNWKKTKTPKSLVCRKRSVLVEWQCCCNDVSEVFCGSFFPMYPRTSENKVLRNVLVLHLYSILQLAAVICIYCLS